MAKTNVFKLLVEELSGRALDAYAAEGAPAAYSDALTDVAREAACELAFLAVNADGKIGDEEESLLRACFEQLDDPALYGRRFDSFSVAREREGRSARVVAAAAALPTEPAKRLAYALVFALGNADLARAPEEERFERQVASALGLSADEAEQLNSLVMSKLAIA